MKYINQEHDKLTWEILALQKQKELVLSAAKAVLNSWDERMCGDKEVKNTNIEHDFTYWSPVASLVASETIHNLREAIKLAEQQ